MYVTPYDELQVNSTNPDCNLESQCQHTLISQYAIILPWAYTHTQRHSVTVFGTLAASLFPIFIKNKTGVLLSQFF